MTGWIYKGLFGFQITTETFLLLVLRSFTCQRLQEQREHPCSGEKHFQNLVDILAVKMLLFLWDLPEDASFSVITTDWRKHQRDVAKYAKHIYTEEWQCDSLCLNRRLHGAPTDQPEGIRGSCWWDEQSHQLKAALGRSEVLLHLS